MSGQGNKYPPELRERAMRMVAEVQGDYPSQWAAITAVASKLGIGSAETLRKWLRRAEVDAGARVGDRIGARREPIDAKILAVGRTEPCSRIPSGTRRVGPVVAGRDVLERGSAKQAVQPWLQKPDRCPERLIEPGDQSRPQRRDGAGATDRLVGAVHENAIAGSRVRVAADVRPALNHSWEA